MSFLQIIRDFRPPSGYTAALVFSAREMNIFVGNLGPDVTEAELADLFREFGQVASVQLMREQVTGKPRGHGFVEMPGKNHSRAAIAGLNGREFAGRPLKVNEARPRPERGRPR
jgi:RNA recognition motif-containing protein